MRPAANLDRLTGRTEGEVKRWLARELHDSVAQILTVMVVDLETFKRDEAAHQRVVDRADSLQASTREVLHNLRQVLHELREESSTDDDFGQRVGSLLQRFAATTGIGADLTVSGAWPARLPAATAQNLSRILEEALTNVRNHSGATAVTVELAAAGDDLELIVRDNGRGGLPLAGGRRPGMGMVGMRERAVLLGGELEVSDTPGGGTTVRAAIPNATKEIAT